MRILAIDLGDVRTGIAVSDLTRTLAGEAWTVTERNRERLVETIMQAVNARAVSQIVLGYPKNMDGSAGERAEKSVAFKEQLALQTAIPITLWDERRTSWEAEGILLQAGKRGKKKKERVDAVAASLILEGFLRSL